MKASLVTTGASAVVVQEPEPDMAEPELPVVEVERSLSADGAVARSHPCRVRGVEDEAGVASQKARVVEDISSLPPPVPAGSNSSPVALATGGEGSDCHARDPC